jgi:outer membrane beta-barrel protein
MNARHRIGYAALALAATVTAALPRPAAAVPHEADAFAGKIPPVSGQLYQKAGRLELTASADLSLNDAFFRKYFGGLKLGYHLTESWSLSAFSAGGFATRSGSALVCSPTTGCSNATETQLRQVPGHIRAIAGVEVAWAPVYGKLNVLASQVVHFDLSILGGVDAVLHDEVLSGPDADRLTASGGTPTAVTTGGVHAGLGARLFFSEAWALRLEVKDFLYLVKVPNNGPGNDLQNQLFTEVGVSFFFPTRNRAQR